MAKIFLVYSANQWHEYSSMDVVGAFTDKQMAIDNIIEHLNEEEDDDEDELRYQLEQYSQTQSRRKNYIIEETEVNEWLG